MSTLRHLVPFLVAAAAASVRDRFRHIYQRGYITLGGMPVQAGREGPRSSGPKLQVSRDGKPRAFEAVAASPDPKPDIPPLEFKRAPEIKSEKGNGGR